MTLTKEEIQKKYEAVEAEFNKLAEQLRHHEAHTEQIKKTLLSLQGQAQAYKSLLEINKEENHDGKKK